ncbi:hypothetical protein GCM10010502_71210 [Kitasatospora aureofaciens]|uniref:Uncharacterized protein n=1 Tax=Kitasatospora aureofaciens TaxID=1894 RepID=A0A8H9HZT4_KITAU|nr:hypothetical protein GCM10010502_71210 [Kitasatospora aureofaciens]
MTGSAPTEHARKPARRAPPNRQRPARRSVRVRATGPAAPTCGGRFMTQMNEADLRETKAGKIVAKPACDMKSRTRGRRRGA